MIKKRAAPLMCKILSHKLLSRTAILVLAATSQAFAADLPMKAPAAAPIPFTWTGCHVGGHLGGVVSDDRTVSALGATVGFSSTGFTGGGQIGCDYQFASNWVVGFEGQAAWTSLKNTHGASVRNLVTGATAPSQFTLRNDFLASATARLGYSFVDHWLFYARGGAAWTHEKVDDAYIAPVLSDCRRSRRDREPDRLDGRRRHGVGLRAALVGERRIQLLRFRQRRHDADRTEQGDRNRQ